MECVKVVDMVLEMLFERMLVVVDGVGAVGSGGG